MKYYTDEHEWLEQTESKSVWRVGITDFAQDQLGDIVHIQLPKVGSEVRADDSCSVVESVKSASDINAPLAGTVLAVNGALHDDPAVINSDAEGEGWIFEMEVHGEPDLSAFMDSETYLKTYSGG